MATTKKAVTKSATVKKAAVRRLKGGKVFKNATVVDKAPPVRESMVVNVSAEPAAPKHVVTTEQVGLDQLPAFGVTVKPLKPAPHAISGKTWCTVEHLEKVISKYDGAVVIFRSATSKILTVAAGRSSVYLNARAPKPFGDLRTLARRLAVFGLREKDYVVVSASV